MANNNAPGKGNIDAELMKYAPEKVHQVISKILNKIFETNIKEVKLGTGVLLPLPKPKKTQGPVKLQISYEHKQVWPVVSICQVHSTQFKEAK